jgi:outer membrane protein assembly factor BamB
MRWSALTRAVGAVVLAAGALGSVAVAQDEEREVVSRGFAIPQTREARALAERALIQIEARRWSEAFTLLQELMTQHRGEVLLPPEIEHDTDDLARLGAATWARERLAELPEDAQALYATRYGEEAREALEAARRARDPRALLEVARRYPLTPAAADAWWSLGDLEFELGECATAESSWRRAQAFGPENDQARARQQQRRSEQALAARAAQRFDGDAALPSGESVTWTAVFGRSDAVTPFSNGGGNCLFPAMASDTVLVTDTLRLFAFDAWSGEKRWESGEPEGWGQVDRGQYRPNGSRPLLRREFFENLHRRSLIVRPAASESVAVAALQIPYSNVYNEQYQNYEITNVIPERRLYAFDVETGRELWNHRPPLEWDGTSGPLEHLLSVAAPPVIAGSRVIVPYYRMQGRVDLHVGCFDLYSGERIWSSSLMSGQMALNMFGRQLHEYNAPPVTVAGERVLVSTQLGAIAALDIQSGDILWQALYDQIPVPRASHWEIVDRPQVFATASPAVAGDVVVCAPIDSYDFFGLDLATGTRLWSRPHSALRRPARELLALLGADGERVWFSGQRVVSVRAARGLAEAAPTELQESVDVTNLSEWPRPLLTQRHVLVATPTRRAAFLRTALGTEMREFGVDWESGIRAGNVAAGDGALFYSTSNALFGVIDWRAVEERFRRRSEESPSDPEPALDWAAILERRALVEMSTGKVVEALGLLSSARTKLEPFAGPADDALRGTARARLFSLFLSEARALELAADPTAALERLETGFPLAPDDDSRVRALVQRIELCELLGKHEQRAEMLASLGTLAADRDMPSEWWNLRGSGRFSASVPAASASGVLPVALFVAIENVREARRTADVAAELRHLHALLAAWGDVELPGTDGSSAASVRIGELAEAAPQAHRMYEERADELLAAARERADMAALERLPILYPHTRAALAAARVRLEQALQAGDWRKVIAGVQRMIPDDWSPEVARESELQALMVLRAAFEELGNLPLAGALTRKLARANGSLLSELPRDAQRKLDDLAASLPPLTGFPERPMSSVLARYDGSNTSAYFGMGQISLLGHFEALGPDGARRWIQVQVQRTGRIEIVQASLADNPNNPLWTQTLEPGSVRPMSRAALLADVLVLGGPSQLVGLDAVTGTIRWRWTANGARIDNHVGGAGLMMVTTRGSDGRSSLIALEPREGLELWSRSLPAGLWAHRPIVGAEHVVLLPSDWAQSPAVVLDPFTGSRTRIFKLPSHVGESDAAGAWIEAERLFLPSFPKSSSSGERDCLSAWELETGVRAWRVPCEENLEFDSIVRTPDAIFLVYLATAKQEGGVVEVHPVLGAARRLPGIAIDADDVLVGVRRHTVAESESGLLMLRSPSAEGELTELVALQLPFGRKWVQRLNVAPAALYNSGPMPMPLVGAQTVVVAYTEAPRVRGQVSVPRTMMVMLDRESGAARDTLQLPADLGPADVLDMESFGPNLWIAGQNGVFRRARK